MRHQVSLAACAALAFSLSMGVAGESKEFVQVPLPPVVKREIEQPPLPVGRWTIAYANKVVEICDIHKDGTAVVVEPVTIAGGKAVVHRGTILLIFESGRAQRWTPVGQRFVVEHWFPEARFPSAAPGVVGIAERVK